jgi:hypothetical protein
MKVVRSSSLLGWFFALFLFNMLDIATTMPVYESNPVTLYLWGRIGIFFSAWVKIGLVMLFGILSFVAKKVATPQEWEFTKKVFHGVLIILVVYYAFVVAINLRLILLSVLR